MKILELLSTPVAALYGLGVHLRNAMYDRGIYKGVEFSVPTIVIGNLSVGGSGKTPMTEYLIEEFKASRKLAVISRGYKRRSRGFILAEEGVSADLIGDEPFQLFSKFPDIKVAVGEERALAVVELMSRCPEIDLILFDDAFQHRMIVADCNILLTPSQKPFFKDHFLPKGSLRDSKEQSKRADIIVFTKTENLDEAAHRKNTHGFQAETNQLVLSSGLKYGEPYHLFDRDKYLPANKNESVLLLSAIANSEVLVQYLVSKFSSVQESKFPDHYYFTESDLKKVAEKFQKMANEKKVIITTEKDATRLAKHSALIQSLDLPIYVLPVKTYFSSEHQQLLTNKILGILEAKKSEA